MVTFGQAESFPSFNHFLAPMLMGLWENGRQARCTKFRGNLLDGLVEG